jgi:hypothetical protein
VTIPLPVIANVFRCSLVWDLFGQSPVPVNVIHIKALSGSLNATAAFAAINSSVVAGMWTTSSSLGGIGHVNIIPLDGTSATTPFTTDGTAKWKGQQTGDYIPVSGALVKFTTGLRGRANRGRFYIPVTAEAAVQDGAITSTYLPTAQTGWNSFLANLQAATPNPFELVVASYDREHSGNAAHATPVTAVTVESLTATQRRRQPGRKVSRH